MTATTLDGKAILGTIKEELRQRVAALAEHGVVPGLGTVLVGDDPGSQWYVGAKHRDCAEIGIRSLRRDLPAGTSLDEVLAVVHELNDDPECTGFIVQQPTGLDENAILSAVDPAKDVDGLHPTNLGWLVLGHPAPLPCTPVGCIELLRRYDVPIAGAKVVVVGRGITVGRPLGLILTRKSENATVTLCHTGTRDLAAEVRQADIVVAAAGRARHHHRRHGQARCRRARRRRLPRARPRPPASRSSRATSPPASGTSPASSAPTPAGSAR